MGKRKTYDDETRASVCLMLEAAGYPHTKGALERVAQQVKIPARTISRWFKGEQNPPPDQLVNKKAFDLRAALMDELQAVIGRLPEERGDADYRALMTALGILVDKINNLDGRPTERIAIEHLDNRERAERVTALLNAARTRRTGQSAQYATDD